MNASAFRICIVAVLVVLLSPPAGDASPGSRLSRTSSQKALENHHVMLRVVLVTPDWMPFASTDGWTRAVSVKESDVLKYYETAIWEETTSVHLYAFPNDYDAGYGYSAGVTDEQKIAHREQFLIRKYTEMPAAWTEERSVFLKSAFVDMASYLVNEHPDSEHHLMYSGHGGPGGKLFNAQLYENHANEFLKSWTQTLGRPLGVIDMGGPCTKGSFSDLGNFSEYARYYVASDLPNGGYTMDQWTSRKHDETDPATQYHNLLSTNESLEDALKGRIDLKRKGYEYSRYNMVTNKVAQANYLYSCAAFRTFSPDFKTFLGSVPTNYSMQEDLYQYMVDNGASSTLIAQFNSVIVHRADNKDFFVWSEDRNGIRMPRPEAGGTPPVSTVTPLSERTPQVRDAIVTEARLAQFYSLALGRKNITSLKAGDFDGLTSLTTLSLSNNQLGTLPEGLFEGLTSLTLLDLASNQLDTLPVDIFDGLTSLATLNLWGNLLTTLPEGLFDGLTSLTTLNLGNNQLGNLPAGIFVGLTELKSLHLYGNAIDPLPISVSLEEVGEGQFKAVVPTGAPFNVVLPLSVTNGTISGGAASSVTISTGSAESPPLTVARTPATTAAVTVNIGTLPGLPSEVNRFNILLHQGYALVKSGDLPLETIAATVAATDFNGDGRTDFVDFFLFADAYGGTDAKFDLDGNGTVDFADFFRFVDAFGS